MFAWYLINCVWNPFLEWGAWFIKNSKQFESNIARDNITALMVFPLPDSDFYVDSYSDSDSNG